MQDTPGILVRPPFLYGGALLLSQLLRLAWPLPIFSSSVAPWPGIPFIVAGVSIAFWGRRTLWRAQTPVNPCRPTTCLVTAGPYRFSRNPLYLALTLIFTGVTLATNNVWGFLLLAPVLAILLYGVIHREERYLERKFGDVYRQYRARVRRFV